MKFMRVPIHMNVMGWLLFFGDRYNGIDLAVVALHGYDLLRSRDVVLVFDYKRFVGRIISLTLEEVVNLGPFGFRGDHIQVIAFPSARR